MRFTAYRSTAAGLTAASGVLAAVLLLAPAEPVLAQATQPAQSSAVKDMLGKLWGRLRAATPRSQASAGGVTVTAGLRGAEATESELKPYWRGDREQAGEREALEKAQALADAGNFADAAKTFESFLQANPKSPLAANAMFGAALSRAAMGDKARATAGFSDFLKQQPQHPLAKDAEQALAALK
jgi:TolA-binding protein